jgi:hypothetical protein
LARPDPRSTLICASIPLLAIHQPRALARKRRIVREIAQEIKNSGDQRSKQKANDSIINPSTT